MPLSLSARGIRRPAIPEEEGGTAALSLSSGHPLIALEAGGEYRPQAVVPI